MLEDDRAQRILTYWLDDVGETGWYEADPMRDETIRARFSADFADACRGHLQTWVRVADQCLALLILLDQFSRNILRGKPEAYSGDARALAVAGTALRLGHDRSFEMPARQFFYLPFMHSERLADQERCVRLFLLNGGPTGGNNLDHAVKHREVIRRFGRFPSRNAALGRQDSAKERSYRNGGGYMG
ncbi:MAG: DUF924 family protein [Pseudomonadota bacterium]